MPLKNNFFIYHLITEYIFITQNELKKKVEKCKKIMDDPQRDSDEYYDLLASIANIFQAKKDLGESKINIAKQVYESVYLLIFFTNTVLINFYTH